MISITLALSFATPPACRSNAGEWVQEFEERQYHRGRKVDGKKHGLWISAFDPTFSDGYYVLAEWRHGVQHGVQQYYLDGEMFQDVRFRHGREHGRWRVFNGPGRLDTLQWVVDRKRHWWACHWHPETGALDRIEYYQFGVRRLHERNPVVCPALLGDGARHLDPDDRDYDVPPDSPRGAGGRPIPIPLP